MRSDAVQRLRDCLQRRQRRIADSLGARRAAVLVPLFGSRESLKILFFERTHEVVEHKGEICFPGGSLEPGDEGLVSAALREAHEELALVPADVQVLGMLDDVETHVTNYAITPVVGYIEAMPALRLDPLEVARLIVVPLAKLFEPGVEATEQREGAGTIRFMYSYSFDGNRVWGATGRITRSLMDALRSEDEAAT